MSRKKVTWCLLAIVWVYSPANPITAQNMPSGSPPSNVSVQPTASPTASPPSAQDQELASNLEKARRTLEFGIDSSVISVINQSKGNKDKRLASEIAKSFDSINPEVQKAAIDYFVTLQDFSPHARVVEKLAAFNDLPVDVVVKLLEFIKLEKLPAETALMDNLIQMSQSAKVDIQSPAVDAIAACGTAAQIEGLIKLFKKSGTATTVRSAILRAMGKYPTTETSKLLKDVIGDTGEEKVLRYEALTALGKQGTIENLALIKPSLTSGDVFERGAAINALSGFATADTIALYRQALRDGMWRNRVGVLKIINEKKIGELEEAVMFIAEEDPEKPVKAEALRALATLDGAAGWAMMERLFKEPKTTDESRGAIAELLITKHFGQSIEVIRSVFMEEYTKEKSWLFDVVCRELSTIKNLGTAGFYEKMLNHANFIIQIYAVRGIKENGFITYRGKLEELLKTKPSAALKSTIEDALK